ncbi:MAG: hypothetical protein JNK82_30235 [Myxococcaceae bacterium]|nr:hypothetical protein [Myxococcaceae bacterium]
MATKAQLFRYETERSHPKQAPRTPRPPKRRSTPDGGARNVSLRAGKKAAVATEASLSGRPSRKSSRPSAHHGKNSTVLEYAARLRSMSPTARHAKRGAL